ncbi:MAG: tetratricopeptide repeat protein [Gemmatimonadales bacterium]|nr:tetratricopeptide repeat protein [Gemmatimonadales bacterium]
MRRGLGWLYYYGRRYDQARYHFTRAIAMNPTAEETYRILGLTFAELGRFEEAERVLREAAGLPGAGAYAAANLGHVLARAGKRDEAAAILAQLVERSGREYVSPVAFALLYIGLGDFDRALLWSERAFEERRGWMAYLKVHPVVDPLRSHPRFQELVRRMKL